MLALDGHHVLLGMVWDDVPALHRRALVAVSIAVGALAGARSRLDGGWRRLVGEAVWPVAATVLTSGITAALRAEDATATASSAVAEEAELAKAYQRGRRSTLDIVEKGASQAREELDLVASDLAEALVCEVRRRLDGVEAELRGLR